MLTNANILITRPQHQAINLLTRISELGGHGISCPTIDIVAPTDITPLVRAIKQLDTFDYAIFVSANAVYYTALLIQEYAVKIPKQLKIVAIGSGTAQVLRDANLPVVIMPTTNFSSEGLLELNELQTSSVSGKNIIIFAGLGGRDLLAATLTARGAQVTKAISYQRQMPKLNKNMQEILHANLFDIIVSTSAEGLHNLVAMISKPRQAKLFGTDLIVISDRMANDAHRLGFRKVFAAKNASDDAIIETLLAWKKEKKHGHRK